MSYKITTEFYSMPAVGRYGNRQTVEFHYAIRRSDGSLCFRAPTIQFADLLIERLVWAATGHVRRLLSEGA